jgi:hypothetical protein
VVSQTNTDHLVVMENYANQGTYYEKLRQPRDLFCVILRCVVITTGKIKTDFSRENEWYSGIDKDGTSIEDDIPVVTLSRKKKDK